jgi:hypothetical protein
MFPMKLENVTVRCHTFGGVEVMQIIGLWLYTSGYHFPRDHVRIFHPLKLKTMWHVQTINHDEALQGSAAKGQILSFTDATGYLT